MVLVEFEAGLVVGSNCISKLVNIIGFKTMQPGPHIYNSITSNRCGGQRSLIPISELHSELYKDRIDTS